MTATVVAKTVSLQQSHVGLTIIRVSDRNHESVTERVPMPGGLVEFHRSPDQVLDAFGHQPAGFPEARPAGGGEAVSGDVTPDTAMDHRATKMGRGLARLERAGGHAAG